MTAIDVLNDIDACDESIKWAGDKTVEEAWATCHRGDWMAWYYATMYPDNVRELTLAKAHCVELVRQYMRDARSITALNAAMAYGQGKRETLDPRILEEARLAFKPLYLYDDTTESANAYAITAVCFASNIGLYHNEHDEPNPTSLARMTVIQVACSMANAAVALNKEGTKEECLKEYCAEYDRALRVTADICRKYLTLGDIK